MGRFPGPGLGCGLGAGSEPRADSAMSGCSATLRKWAARTAADLLRAAAAPLGRALVQPARTQAALHRQGQNE